MQLSSGAPCPVECGGYLVCRSSRATQWYIQEYLRCKKCGWSQSVLRPTEIRNTYGGSAAQQKFL